jgi:hypothetical protein
MPDALDALDALDSVVAHGCALWARYAMVKHPVVASGAVRTPAVTWHTSAHAPILA